MVAVQQPHQLGSWYFLLTRLSESSCTQTPDSVQFRPQVHPKGSSLHLYGLSLHLQRLRLLSFFHSRERSQDRVYTWH